jgi:hypothetical protein
MEKTFTQEDLIRFIYQETSHQESHQILAALHEDFELRESLKELMTVVGALDELKYEPRNTILQILNEEASSSSMEIS